MQFETRTPQAIALRRRDGSHSNLPPVAPAVRLELAAGPVERGLLGGMPIRGKVTLKGVSGLPAPRDGVMLVVSQMAALAIAAIHPERTDCLHPASGLSRAVTRDRDGVSSVAALIRV